MTRSLYSAPTSETQIHHNNWDGSSIVIQQRPISADTVCRRLASNNIHCRRPAWGPILRNRHQQDRLQWVTGRQHWRYQQWRRVLRWMAEYESGEKELRVTQIHVWRRETFGGGQSIMVWGAIGINHKAGLVISQNMASRHCGISIKSFDFILYPILTVTRCTCSSRTKHVPTLPESSVTLSSSTKSKSCHGLPSVRIWIQ